MSPKIKEQTHTGDLSLKHQRWKILKRLLEAHVEIIWQSPPHPDPSAAVKSVILIVLQGSFCQSQSAHVSHLWRKTASFHLTSNFIPVLSSTNSKPESYWDRGSGKCGSQLLLQSRDSRKEMVMSLDLAHSWGSLSVDHHPYYSWTSRVTEQVLNFRAFESTGDPWTTQVWAVWVYLYVDFFSPTVNTYAIHSWMNLPMWNLRFRVTADTEEPGIQKELTINYTWIFYFAEGQSP